MENETKHTPSTEVSREKGQGNAQIVSGQNLPTNNPFTTQKDIMQTWGGKKVRGFIDWGIGLGFNSTLSGAIVYYVNPNENIKKIKDRFGEGGSSARRALEILSAYVAGIITTVALSAVAPFEEKIAYRLNQWAGKDKDIKTNEMKLAEWNPQTREDQIEYEIAKRVDERKNWKDVWKARLLGMAIVLPGNELLGRLIRYSEAKTGHSLDTAVWKAGGAFYNLVAKSEKGNSLLDGANEWFKDHDAGVNDIRRNVGDSYFRLEQVEAYGKVIESDLAKARRMSEAQKPAINETRVATREFFRTMFGVEIPWTIVMAGIVSRWSQKFQKQRVAKERNAVISELKAQGIIPVHYDANAVHETRIAQHSPEFKQTSTNLGGIKDIEPILKSYSASANKKNWTTNVDKREKSAAESLKQKKYTEPLGSAAERVSQPSTGMAQGI